MPDWLNKALDRIKARAAARRVMFTLKARREIASLALDEDDACDVLARLKARDSVGRQKAADTGEWMYIFKPELCGTILYVKTILRSNCILVSFHEDTDDE